LAIERFELLSIPRSMSRCHGRCLVDRGRVRSAVSDRLPRVVSSTERRRSHD